MTKWIPPIMIAGACALSAILMPQLPEYVMLDMKSWLPPGVTTPPEPLPRLAALFGLPAIALLTWIFLHEAPISPLGKLGSAMFRPFTHQPALSQSDYDKFAPTYRVFVSWVMSLMLGLHISLLADVLDWPIAPGLIVGLVFGIGLIAVGNVTPRLRPNPIAGVRTIATLRDPLLWARVHRTLGALWMVGGMIVLVAGIIAPRYALVTSIAVMLLAALGGLLLPRHNLKDAVES